MGIRRLGRATRSLVRVLSALAIAIATVVAVPQAGDAAQQESPASSWYTNGSVRDLVRVGDVVYAGGDFTKVRNSAGQTKNRSNVAAFHATTGEVLAWAPAVDGPVYALEASPDGSRIYIGGDFRTVDGSSRKRLAAVDLAGRVDGGFRADAGGRVLDLVIDDDVLIVAGELTALGGRSRTLIGRVDAATGSIDRGWAPDIDGGSVRGIELSPDRNHLYVGGNFSNAGGLSNTAYAARISMADGSPDRGWRPALDMPVFDIESTGSNVYIAVGGLGFENNRLQKHSASDGSELLRYLASGDVQDLELNGTTLYVGGHFTKVFGGLPRGQLAAIDIRDDHITDFGPEVLTLYGVWKVLAGPDGVWLGGDFTEVEGTSRQGIAFLPNDGQPEIDGTLLLNRSKRWRYYDTGSAPSAGTDWAQAGFNDGGWDSGVGEIGFGDGDERTLTDQTDALYARASMWVDDPTDFDDVALRVLADAGAAIYLNGREVARHNLPAGTLTAETIAVEGKWTTGEKTWFETHVAASRLVAGTNTVAVEVHGAYDKPSDMSFNMEIVGRVTGDPPDPGVDPVTFVTPGSTWAYLDDGSLTTTAWRQSSYDDRRWATGRAQFGFGDGDEQTELERGHNSYLFRQQFDVSERPETATLRLLADDGAAVYINGIEVARDNLPGGTITTSTGALDSRWGAGERTWREIQIDASALKVGANTVAVSIHNVWSGNSDLSFDLALEGTGQGGGGGPVVLVADNASWRFLDTGADPGSSWAGLGYSDNSWATGRGQFGFGDGDETTLVSSGHRSYFFRREFSVAQIPDALSLSITYDDGVAVYLNGQEVARRNIPDGSVTAATTALSSRWGAAESTPDTIVLDGGLLRQGDNVLAVSVHNVWSGNSDLSFEAELIGNG